MASSPISAFRLFSLFKGDSKNALHRFDSLSAVSRRVVRETDLRHPKPGAYALVLGSGCDSRLRRCRRDQGG
jgi:hypothetical protein